MDAISNTAAPSTAAPAATLPHDLLIPLIDGAFEEPMWQTFLDRLLETTASDYCSLVFRPPGLAENTVFHLFAGERCPPVIQQLYRESAYRTDPTPYHEMAEGRPYALHELLRADDPAHAAYLHSVLEPSGMNVMRMMRVTEPGGVDAWLTISRAADDYDAATGALVGALAPYLRSVVRGFVALEGARVEALLAGEAIRRLNYGWLMLDAAGRVLEADAQGENILALSGVLGLDAKGQLVTPSRSLNREIAQAISSLATRAETRPRAMIVNRDPWMDMLLVPAHGRSLSARSAPAVIAYVHGDSWTSADRVEQLAELFDLLPSEARLALALSRGMSIAEAADELGLSVESARTYSKRVYAKTGARGQAELVGFIHRSVLAIA